MRYNCVMENEKKFVVTCFSPNKRKRISEMKRGWRRWRRWRGWIYEGRLLILNSWADGRVTRCIGTEMEFAVNSECVLYKLARDERAATDQSHIERVKRDLPSAESSVQTSFFFFLFYFQPRVAVCYTSPSLPEQRGLDWFIYNIDIIKNTNHHKIDMLPGLRLSHRGGGQIQDRISKRLVYSRSC